MNGRSSEPQDAVAHLPGEAGVGVGQQHAELVAAQPRHPVRVAEGVAEPPGQVAHDQVARCGGRACS